MLNAVFKPVSSATICILKTPYSVLSRGALNEAAIAKPSTILVSDGSMIPSSQSRAVDGDTEGIQQDFHQ